MSLDKLVNAILPDPINLEVIKEMLDECVVKLPIAHKYIFRGLPSVQMYNSLPSTTSNIMVVAVCVAFVTGPPRFETYPSPGQDLFLPQQGNCCHWMQAPNVNEDL